MQPRREPFDGVAVGQHVPPALGNRVHAVVRAGQLAIHRASGVRIVSKVDGFQGAFFERRGVMKGPQRGFE